MKKVISVALALLAIAGICRAQVIITTDQTNVTFTSNSSAPAAIIGTNQAISLQGCTFNAPLVGLGDNAQANGSGVTILNCAFNCTSTNQPSFGIYFTHNPAGLLCNVSTFSGQWSAPVAISGASSQLGSNFTFNSDNFTNCTGPILLTGVDAAPNATVEFLQNAFSGELATGNLILITNNGTAAALTIFCQGNTAAQVNGKPFQGYVLEANGSFQGVNMQGLTGAKCFYVGTVYSPPSAAGHN